MSGASEAAGAGTGLRDDAGGLEESLQEVSSSEEEACLLAGDEDVSNITEHSDW